MLLFLEAKIFYYKCLKFLDPDYCRQPNRASDIAALGTP